MTQFSRIAPVLLTALFVAFLPISSTSAASPPKSPRVQIVAPNAPDYVKGENGEIYFKPSLKRIINLLIRLGAVDLKVPSILNEYIMISDCRVYDRLFHDEFRWHDVQTAALASVAQNKETWPQNIYYDAGMRLDRYDFASGMFLFLKTGLGEGANTFSIDASGEGYCAGDQVKFLPTKFKIVLPHIVRLKGIPMDREKAEKLVESLNLAKNTGRLIHARFKLHNVFAERFVYNEVRSGGNMEIDYAQGGRGGQSMARIDGRLDLMEFYEDEDRTRLIATMKP